MSARTAAREALINVALEYLLSDRAEPSANSDAQQEYDEERLEAAATKLVVAVNEKELRRVASLPFAEYLHEATATVNVLCLCQQKDPPLGGCGWCEGDGYRTIEIRRDGTVRASGGIHGWTEWRAVW